MAKFVQFNLTTGGIEVHVNPDLVTHVQAGPKTASQQYTNIWFGKENGIAVQGTAADVVNMLRDS